MAYGHSFGLSPLKAPVVIAEKRKVLFSFLFLPLSSTRLCQYHWSQVAVELKHVAAIALAGRQEWCALACKCPGNCCLMMHVYSAMWLTCGTHCTVRCLPYLHQVHTSWASKLVSRVQGKDAATVKNALLETCSVCCAACCIDLLLDLIDWLLVHSSRLPP